MVYDKLDNIDFYKGISDEVYEGLLFLRQATPGIPNGVYQINPRVKAIVSEYETKEENEFGFETHRRFIDIHGAVKGVEKVCCYPAEKLELTKPYCDETDTGLYLPVAITSQEMIIGDGYFAIFFPQDGHMPQLCAEKPMRIKKVVIKVEV